MIVSIIVVSESASRSVVSNSLQPHGLYSPLNSLGQNTEVGSLSILQGIWPTQGSNPGLPHCRQILYQLSHKGSPSILEWVAYPFSRGSSWPRNWTGVSCIAGGFSTKWAIVRKNYRKSNVWESSRRSKLISNIICMQVRKQQLELDMEQQTGSK